MFLCNKCHEGCGCLGGAMPSRGTCEGCGDVGTCADCRAAKRFDEPRAKPSKPEPTDADRAEAQRLIDAGFYQVSRAHRLLARLPAGKTGRQALLESDACWSEERVRRLGEAHAGDSYLRGRVPPDDQVQVTKEVFAAFRELGGDTYLSKHYAYEPVAVIGECYHLLRALPRDPGATLSAEQVDRIAVAEEHARVCTHRGVVRDELHATVIGVVTGASNTVIGAALAKRIAADETWYRRVAAKAEAEGRRGLHEAHLTQIAHTHTLLRDDRPLGGFALYERHQQDHSWMALVPSDGRPALVVVV